MPTRTLTPGTDVVERALVVDPGQRVPGRASGFPLRREGPAKLTGAAKYTDDLVFPGAWFGTTIRSTIDGLIYAMLVAGTFGWLWP